MKLGRETRQILFDMIASGLFPSKHNTNAYVQGNQFDDILQATGDDDDPSDLRETMQQIGIIGTAGRQVDDVALAELQFKFAL